jgi:ubiquitin C-terminal hydrolase
MKELRFSSCAQQDSQELLAVLLDHINEELRLKRRAMSIEALHVGKESLSHQDAWGNYFLRNNSIVTRVFGGLLKSTVKCGKCSTLSTTFDPFLFLSLPIPSSSAPKLTLNIVGIGRKQIKVNNSNFDQLERDLGFECVFALVDSNYKFLQFVNREDFLSDYSDEQPGDFFDFGKKKNRGLIFVYPKNTIANGNFSLISFCTKSPAYFLTGLDYVGFPLFVPHVELSDIKEYLREKLSINPADWEFKLIHQSAQSSVYTLKIQSELTNSIKWVYDQLLPDSPSSSPSTSQDIISLDDCLAAFEAEETLAQEVGWKCPNCKKSRTAIKCLNIAQLPESSLMIHLKRFSFSAGSTSTVGWFSSGSGRKITTPISFPQFWKIRNSGDNEVVFELYAVIEHYGSLFGGHYTCAARNFLTGQWYRYDDSIVREIEVDSVLENSKASAYVLFYERKAIKGGR